MKVLFFATKMTKRYKFKMLFYIFTLIFGMAFTQLYALEPEVNRTKDWKYLS